MAIESKEHGVLDRLGHFFTKMFYGKDMKKHQKKLDSLHKDESQGKWDDFAGKAKDSSFVKAVKNDPRSSDKLKMHATRLHMLHTGDNIDRIPGSRGGSYRIVKLSDGSLGCTCNDWRYKGSVTPGYMCRHIRKHRRSQNG